MSTADFQRTFVGVAAFLPLALLTTQLVTAQCLFVPEQYVSVGNNPAALAAADFDGDGLIDLATANVSGNVSVLLGVGDGTFGAAQNFATGTESPTKIAADDFNEDGVIDLVTVSPGGQPITVSVLLGDGDGTFGAPQPHPPEEGAAGSIATDDFNGDGLIDLTFAGDTAPFVVVMLGNGDGTFGTETNLSVERCPKSITTGDFNGDGVPDLAVSGVPEPDHLSIHLGLGDGTFGAANAVTVSDNDFYLADGDFNGDGLTDLATARPLSGSVSVLLGNGDGTFAEAQSFPVLRPGQPIVDDFNGDGITDLAAQNRSLNNVSVLLGLGDGTFSAAQYFAVGRLPGSVVSGDFDGDGKVDLANYNRIPDNVTVLLNQGAPLVMGDVSGDGVVNLLDVQPFVDILVSGGFQVEADINQDGIVNLLDVQLFVNLLTGEDDVLFDNGLTLCDGLFFHNSHTGKMSQYQVADDFQLGAGTWSIDRIKWTGNLVMPPQPFFQPEVTVGEIINFDILIFADNGGMPTGQPIDPVPGTAIAHRFVEGVTGSSTGLFMPPFLEVEIAQFEASFDPIILDGQTTYWIVIAANGEQSTYVEGEDGLTWASRGQTEIGNAWQGGTNFQDDWFFQGAHQDLTLYGSAIKP